MGREAWVSAILHCAVLATAQGRLPERPKGAVCKTVGLAYVGSNPTPATTCGNSLWPARMRSGDDLVRVRWRPAETGSLRVLVVEWWLSARILLAARRDARGLFLTLSVWRPLCLE